MGCSIRRILQFKEAVVWYPIKVVDMFNSDISGECMYSWSTDSVCWTNWVDYKSYNNILKNVDGDFYLRVLIPSTFSNILLDGVINKCYTISLDTTNVFLTGFCDEPNLFQPYNNLDCALLLQQQLSDSIICMLGIPVYYIRVIPDTDSADYTFKEFILHNVDSIKQIKLMITDGQLPSSNPKLTEFDFDWDNDWVTELSKTQFATAFDDTAFPKQRDLVYVPLMKRLWEVNAAYDEKNEGLMWRSTTWKLSLVKYNEKTNVDYGDFKDVIDDWVVNKYSDEFLTIEQNEQERLTGNSQLDSPGFIANNLYDIFMEDSIRKQYTKYDVTVLDKTYNHKSNTVGRNIYKFKKGGCITYQKGYCGDSGVLTFIIDTPGMMDIEPGVYTPIIEFGEVVIDIMYDKDKEVFNIRFGDMTCTLKSFMTYMVVIKWGRRNFITEMNVYKYVHREDVPVYRLRPEMWWFDFENPVCDMTAPYNNELISTKTLPCRVHAYPLSITNIKYYNDYLSLEDTYKESIKYTTNHKNCIICDLARPLSEGLGYNVR